MKRSTVIVCLLVLALLTALYLSWSKTLANDPQASMALIIPDGAQANVPLVEIWIDAAREEGLRLDVLHASDFLRPSLQAGGKRYAGVILPDSVSTTASASFAQGLADYTRNGGKLMLVFDAATRNQAGAYYPQRAPLSELVGVDYALYDTLSDHTIELSNVWGARKTLAALGVPPGKSIPYSDMPEGMAVTDPQVIAGYQYGPLRYNSYVTRGDYRGQRLMSTATGNLVAGYHEQGKGGVLFVNLPLGYLKGQTDGLMLHSFLRYFSDVVVALPSLSAAPQGRGGLIFNWHVDSNGAVAPIDALDKSDMLSQGPFSIHFTAGPDARQIGDGLGLHLTTNPVMKRWIARFKARGDALGDHGGWIHDYFGLNVSDNNQAEMEHFLVLNDQALQAVNGGPVREYSAPVGTMPKWVTQWLEQRGFVAYYFTGNSGLGATRSYREGQLYNKKIWSFPVLTYGQMASFEEAAEQHISEPEMATWLRQISDFSADSGSIRTFYSHPPGFKKYQHAISSWFARTRQLLDQKKFSWYTMTQVADFLNRREQTIWHIHQRGEAQVIEASNPLDLDQMTWKFPKSHYAQPVVEAGQGVVSENAQYWMLAAGSGKTIRISSQLLKLKGE